MPESLALSWEDLQAEVGFYLGFGRSPTDDNWDAEKIAVVKAVIKAGLSAFYWPKPLGSGKAHSWSFLRPVETFATVSGTYAYALPADFGGFDGGMVIDESTAYPPLRKTGIPEVMKCQGASPQLTGTPRIFADGPRVNAGLLEQTFEVWLHPTPNAVLTMRYRYRINPKMIDVGRPHPLGGAQHSDTILASCLAIAERRVNDTSGDYQIEFAEKLAASISLDCNEQPDHFGYNGDGPGGRWMGESGRRWRTDNGVQMLYNGQLPEDYT